MPVPFYCYVCTDTGTGTRAVHIDADGHEVFTNFCPKKHKISTGCVVHFAREHEITLCSLPIRRHGPRTYTAVATEVDCLKCMLELASQQPAVDWRPASAIAEDHYAF